MTLDRAETLRRLAKLESDVAAAINQYGEGEIDRVRMAPGEEEADLSSNVDLLVQVRGRPERVFTIVTLSAMTRFLSDETAVRVLGDFYTTGGPLIVVKQMSAEVIARGVVKYLGMEGALGC